MAEERIAEEPREEFSCSVAALDAVSPAADIAMGAGHPAPVVSGEEATVMERTSSTNTAADHMQGVEGTSIMSN